MKRPPGSPPLFKARYVERGFSQCKGVDIFQTFAPTPKMTTLRVLLHIAAQHDYELHCVAAASISLRPAPGSLRHTCTDLGELQHYLDLQITRDRATRTNSVTQSHMVEQILTRFRFSFSKVQLTPLAVDHGLTAPPSDEQLSPAVHILSWVAKYVVSTSGMGLVLGGKQPVTLTGFSESSWADDAESLRSTQGYCFSLGTRAASCRSTRASSVSSSSCEAKVYAAAMATQELRWLSFLLTDLGEWPRSPLVLFADNM
ncbi:unnamed protein product [Closterium sp. NIES-53]